MNKNCFFLFFALCKLFFSNNAYSAVDYNDVCNNNEATVYVNKPILITVSKLEGYSGPFPVNSTIKFNELIIYQDGNFVQGLKDKILLTARSEGVFQLQSIFSFYRPQTRTSFSRTCSKKITVISEIPPRVELIKPISTSTIYKNQNINITYKGIRTNNNINNLKIKKDNTVVHTCKSNFSNCSFSFQGTALGQYKFTAVAEDSFGIKSAPSSVATVNVVEKNTSPEVTLISDKKLVNSGSSIKFTLTAKDNDKQNINQIKSFNFCVGSTCNPVSYYQSTCATTGTNLSCSFDLRVSSNTIFKAVASDGSTSVFKELKNIILNDTPTVSIKTSNSTPFIDEEFTITAEASDAQGLKDYQICEYPAGSLPNTATKCSGSKLLKSCNVGVPKCSVSINKSSVANNSYYLYVEDKYGLKAHANVPVNVLLPFGVRLEQLPASLPFDKPVTLTAKIGALTSKTHALQLLKLLVNGKDQTVTVTPSLSSPQPLPAKNNEHKTFSLTWRPKTAGNVSVQLIATDTAGKSKTSAAVTSKVALPSPATPSVTIGTQSNGQYTVKINPVAHAQSYTLYENEQFYGEYSSQSTNVSISKSFNEHNKVFRYCASSKNTYDGKLQQSSVGTGAECKSITVNNPQPIPSAPIFSTHNLQQSGPYSISWKNNNDGLTSYYKLERWQGNAADAQTATKELLYNLNGLFTHISEPMLGNYTYQISACNSQNNCTKGQLLTFNHIPAYIQQAEIDSSCGSNCLNIKGLGFNSKTLNLDVRLRNTAEVFNYSINFLNSSPELSYVNEYKLQFKAPPRVIEGLNNGGLYLELSNGVLNAQKGSIIIDNTGANTGFDMILHAPAVSSTGSIYVGSGNDIYALDALGQERWKVTTGDKVIAMPLLTTKNGRDNIIVGSFDHNIYSLNHDGVEQWVTQTRGPIKAAAQIDQHKNIYVGSMDNALYSLNQNTGAIQWQYIFPSGISQQPIVSASNKLYITTDDQQLHIIDRNSVTLNALQWNDIDNSLIKNLLNNEPDGWEPSQESQNIIQITKLFYALLQRAPTKAELTFFAYAQQLGIGNTELINAFLNSEKGLINLPVTDSNSVFINKLYVLFFASENPVINSKTKAQWLAELNQGLTRAALIDELIFSAYRFDIVAHNTVYYFYDFCLSSRNCQYETDSDGDNLSDEVEILLGQNPLDPRDGLNDKPNINYTDLTSGQYELSFNYPSNTVFFELSESRNAQSERLLASVTNNRYAIDLANGEYQFWVKACIEVTLKTGQLKKQCSQRSDPATILVTTSVQEPPIQVALNESIAGKNWPGIDVLNTSASLSPTSGSFRVTENGSANYTVPISLPAGIAGVQPEVALTYDSQTPETSVGLGWGISAGSSISRCRQTVAQDGQFSGLKFTESDRYCLDGQRLILLDDSYAEGEVGATYKTEIDSQLLITIANTTTGSKKMFVVEGKDGSKKYYGGTLNSEVAIAEDKVLTWNIRKIYDNLENESTAINFIYTSNENLGAGEKALEQITYSGNKVVFEYQAGDIRSHAYVNGSEFTARAQLDDIKVYNHNEELLFNYNLTFENAENGVRLLKSVAQCSGYVCKKPIEFKYNEFNNSLNFEAYQTVFHTSSGNKLAAVTQIDTQGDGKSELATLERVDGKEYLLCLTFTDGNNSEICKTIHRFDGADIVQMMAVDPQSDGKQVLWINMRDKHSRDNDYYWSQYNFNENNNSIDYSSLALTGTDRYMTDIRLGDLDGDGYADIIHKRGSDDEKLYARFWQQDTQSYSSRVGLGIITHNNDRIGRTISYQRNLVEDDTPWYMLDLNFDGLADILTLGCSSYKCDGNTEVDQISAFINTNNGKDLEQVIIRSGKAKHLQPNDFNGDGLVDLLFYDIDDNNWKILLNEGGEELTFTQVFRVGNMSEHIAPLSIDINRDGKLELFFIEEGSSTWTAYQFDPASKYFYKNEDLAFNTSGINYEEGDYAYFTDHNHDAVPDIFFKIGHKIEVKYNLNEVFSQGMLREVSQGYGSKTVIDYGLMSDPQLYSKYNLENAAQYPAASENQSAAADRALYDAQNLNVTDLIGSSPLVKTVTTDSPSTLSPSDTLSVDYRYAGARLQFGGRGWLGFRKLTTETEKDGYTFETNTYYRQAFPFIGMPDKTEKYMVSGSSRTLLSSAANSYTNVTSVNANSLNSNQVYNANTKECSARIDTDLTVSGYNCTVTTTVQDEHANVSELTVDKYEQNTGFLDSFNTNESLSSVTTVNNYGTSDYDKRFGRLSATTVTHSQGELTPVTRNTEFSYYPSNHQNEGMLKDEIVMPQGGCDSFLKTTHIYDSLGNETAIQTANLPSCDGVSGQKHQTRSKTSTFDSEGRYAISTANDLFTEQTVNSRNKFGQPTAVTDVNGTKAYFQYDVFGSKVSSYSATGAQTSTYMSDCDTSNCIAQVNKLVNGELVEKQYIDKAGRTTTASKITVLGDWLTTYTQHDKHGRSLSQTSPGMLAITSSYDVFDRPIQIDDPNSNITTNYELSGLEETVTLTGDIPQGTQVKTTLSNALGQTASVTDNAGNVLTYTYDVLGNLETVHSSADNQILSTITYDVLGRKKSMNDKDRGNWRYTYTAFGELKTQTDARGIVTTNSYDILGRKTKQTVTGEQTSQWVFGTGNTVHQLMSESIGNEWQKNYYYDNFGRAVASLTNVESALNCTSMVAFNTRSNDLRYTDARLNDPLTSRCVIQQTNYDEFGRPLLSFDDYRRNVTGEYTEARGIHTTYQNGQVLKRQEAREGTSFGRVYYQVNALNDRGQVIGYNKGQELMTVSYDDAGHVAGISTGTDYIQADSYSFDGMGNLTSRHLSASQQQTFAYDNLNRVTTVDGQDVYSYADNGNLELKDGWEQRYNETANSPIHGITSRSKGTMTETFGYDKNGNQTWAKKNGTNWRTVTYSGRNKATEISINGKSAYFNYDANNRRYKRVDTEQTIYYVGALELTVNHTLNNDQYIKRYIGNDAMQTYYAAGNASIKWLFTDHQGSITAITNDNFKLLKRFAYDVFGQQSEIAPTALEAELHYALPSRLSAFNAIASNTRGYTGHEQVMLDGDNRVIHMNGRIYDAGTGRMMQADPVVQAPSNLQNYNAYSYVLNNPLSYTDPSGYFIKALTKIAGFVAGGFLGGLVAHQASKWISNSRTLTQLTIGAVGVFTSIACGPCSIGFTALATSHLTYYKTGSTSMALQAGLTAGATAAVFYGIGQYFKGLAASNPSTATTHSFGGLDLTSGQIAGQVTAHAVAGGVIADLQGGKFGHGFFAAGVTKGAGGRFLPGGNDLTAGQIVQGTVASAVIGGTASVISGGKFANGAKTAIYQYLFNQSMRFSFTKGQSVQKYFDERYKEGSFNTGIRKVRGPTTLENGITTTTIPIRGPVNFSYNDMGGNEVSIEAGLKSLTAKGYMNSSGVVGGEINMTAAGIQPYVNYEYPIINNSNTLWNSMLEILRLDATRGDVTK
ncbi:hypothetical protein PUND_b0484 [Pseudoalteromonas undina]|uniref:Integrins alpha chain n=1 Tax=Pseudoalteromonas undina TaxID=43660 RepID=A0ABN0NIB4_9GAMM|nr:FG-GAP-like repeat-containing protein [Pseudoalteromonas undina]KAF7763146.1 hypothetical protein PUND_b0484 [Pseudoalteromonas undina]